jgi:hypothetical protein
VTGAWVTRFHSKVRAFVEKEIVELECGRGNRSCLQVLQSPCPSIYTIETLCAKYF